MDERKARKILGSWIKEDNGLYNLTEYLGWHADRNWATLDGEFTVDELEAIAWWMKNKRRNENISVKPEW